mgnify:CR=1 FL=1
MSLIENLNWRHAVKAYNPEKKVSQEDLNKILEAEVIEEETEEKWKGWIWADNGINGGWVPIEILEISEDNKKAKVLEYYTAKELNVDKDDEILKIKSCRELSCTRITQE